MSDETIIVHKISEVYFRIQCNLEQAMSFRQYTSVKVPDAHFNPKFKMGTWDGRISFFDMRDATLPIGLLPWFVKFCKDYSYDYKFAFDTHELYNDITLEEVHDFYKHIFKDSSYYPRDYQDTQVFKSIKTKRGVIVSPTASGKSLVIYTMIRFLLAQNKRILLVVPNINLCNQMYSDFADYGYTDLKENVSVLYGKSTKYDPAKPILVSTWQSIYKKPASYFADFDAVLVDETHGAKAKGVSDVLKACVNAEYRIGLTGTLTNDLSYNKTIYGYLGPKITDIKSKELIDQGYLAKIKVANMIIKYPSAMVNRSRRYNEEVDLITYNSDRNKIFPYIINNIRKTDNVMILVEKIDKHLKPIKEYLEEEFPDRPIFVIHGATDGDKREEIRKGMEEQDGAILLASYGTMSTGANIKKLHHIIFASSYRSKIKVLQSIGRGLRTHESKERIIIWDIVDDLTWVKRTGTIGYNYVYKHWLERLKYYKDQGFDFINKKLNLKEL